MNENAKKWVEVLRSGAFMQAKGVLHNGEGYCCLGVACQISGLGEFQKRQDDEGDVWYYFGESTCGLPEEVREWLGLSSGMGEFQKDPGDLPSGLNVDALAWRNDAGATFDEIADLIESEPKGLF